MSQPCRVAVVACAPALLPGYAGLVDPLPDLRAACQSAVSWLVAGRTTEVVLVLTAAIEAPYGGGIPRGLLLAEHLLDLAGHRGGHQHVELPRTRPGEEPEVPDLAGRLVLVLADGSARRGDQAPGHLDEEAFAFDATIGKSLHAGDLTGLRELDVDLGAALLAEGAPVLRALAGRLERVESSEVTYDDDPYGVQYWVVRWRCLARSG